MMQFSVKASASRQQRREEERMKHKLITVEEASRLMYKYEQEIKEKYDMLYSLGIVNALHAEPFKFGKKRIAEVLNIFFGQVEGMILKTIDPAQMVDVANKLGIRIEVKDGKLEIEINDEKNNTLYTNKNALKINTDKKIV